MTFLQFLLTEYLGDPNAARTDGVSYWNCPVCGSNSFHTLPIRGEYTKERARCWSAECGFRGDACDMLKEFHPDENYGERLDRLTQLRLLYRKQSQPPRKVTHRTKRAK